MRLLYIRAMYPASHCSQSVVGIPITLDGMLYFAVQPWWKMGTGNRIANREVLATATDFCHQWRNTRNITIAKKAGRRKIKIW